MTPCLEILSLHWWLSISCYQTFYFLQLLLTTTTRPLPHHLRSSFHAIHQLFQRITSSAASEPGHRHRHRPPSSKGILNSSCWHTQTGTGTTESPTSKREDPVPASSCRPGTTGGCVSHRCRLLFFSKLPGWPYNTCFSLFLFVFLYLWSSSTYVSWTNLWHPMHQGLMAVNVPVQDQLCYFSHFLEVSCL